MKFLIRLSAFIDEFNRRIGRSVAWCIVLAAFVSAGNALLRKIFDLSSNSWLELQWWLFSIAFLFSASWALRDNDHVRIDILHPYLSYRVRNIIELIGHFFFLLPITLVLLFTSWNYFLISWIQNEQSKDAGGLPQWLIKVFIPMAFFLLLLQAISEIVKQITNLSGTLPRKDQIETTGLKIRE